MRIRWLCLMMLSGHCLGAADARDLVELPLEQLMSMDIDVTSAAKREQRSFDTAAAVYVVTEEDIRRTGVTTIPDALRMAPGVQVGQINSSEWAVGIRGLGGRFSNYLQVLVDGRSVYNALFAGVSWDEVNLAVEDIQRIEVIRGPGSVAWGANAVNGVINIVTKTPDPESGDLLSVGAGTQTKGRAAAQVHRRLGPDTALRVSGNYRREAGMESITQDLEEGVASSERISLALAHDQGRQDVLLNADVYQMHNDAYWSDVTASGVAASGGTASFRADEDKQGYAVQLRYTYEVDERQAAKVRLSVDDIERDSKVFHWNTANVDADFEYVADLGAHALTVGSNSRFRTSKVRQSTRSEIMLEPEEAHFNTTSLFFHDTLSLGEHWKVETGLRYEYHSEAENNIQGTLRGMWLPTEQQRLWAAISKADSTPSRINSTESRSAFAAIPAGPLTGGEPVQLLFVSDGSELDNTEQRSFEMGYRYAFGDSLSFEAVAFLNKYENFIIADSVTFARQLDPVSNNFYLQTEVDLGGGTNLRSSGAEWTVNWRLGRQWHIQYSGSYINYQDEQQYSSPQLETALPSFNMGIDVPSDEHSLRLSGDLSDRWSMSVWLRHVAELPLVQIDRYTVFDVQLNYQPGKDWRFSLGGRNLGDGSHVEAVRDAYYVDSFEVPSSVYARMTWHF